MLGDNKDKELEDELIYDNSSNNDNMLDAVDPGVGTDPRVVEDGDPGTDADPGVVLDAGAENRGVDDPVEEVVSPPSTTVQVTVANASSSDDL
ncbi:hypothetical protein ACA910_012263 [Epithemia clementina (nom. ined.)]